MATIHETENKVLKMVKALHALPAVVVRGGNLERESGNLATPKPLGVKVKLGSLEHEVFMLIRERRLEIDTPAPKSRDEALGFDRWGWTVEIHAGRHVCFATSFSQGTGHTAPPTLGDVMYCLISDVQSVSCARSFGEWASAMGESDDSIKAKETYEACLAEQNQLLRLFGALGFAALMDLDEDECMAVFNAAPVYRTLGVSEGFVRVLAAVCKLPGLNTRALTFANRSGL